MRKLATVLGLSLLLLPGLAAAEYDVAGNIIDAPPPLPGNDSPGDVCGQCPQPPGTDVGLAFKAGNIHVIASGTIHELQNCQVVGSTAIQGVGFPWGLGYDSTRDMWIIADPGAARIYQVNMAGQVVNSWPSQSARPLGAAYDPNRDLYWVSDWQINQMNSIDPNTGLPGMVRNAPAGTRIAGLGYDAGGDVFYYHGRDQAFGYVMAVQSGALVVSFPLPVGGSNNGQGAGIAPDGNGWHSHSESSTIWCVELAGTTPVEEVTWGSIKAIYE
jgi:hypothetical protein